MKNIACVGVDWGTTSFRLWAIDKSNDVVASRRGNFGMATLKQADFNTVLEENLKAIGVATVVPVVICGMAGAAQGWIQAPYVKTPYNLLSVPHQAIQVPGIERDVQILPGIAQHLDSAPDVMRGEETQLLGAVHHQSLAGTFCLPGTHSKWAWVEEGVLNRFSTAMTGELFGLLATHSTLSPYIDSNEGSGDADLSFNQAVLQAFETPESALQRLFSIRSRSLLKEKTATTAMSSRLSGLLIGLEIAGMYKYIDNEVTLIAAGRLGRNYAQAFDVVGLNYSTLDAEYATRTGLSLAAKIIWPGVL